MSGNWAWSVERQLASKRGAHLPLMEEILTQLESLGWDGRDYFGVQMALEESLANAIKHGNQCDESKVVDVQCKVSAERFWLRVEDEGEGFQPDHVADCTSEEGLEKLGGRGMMLIEAYMTSIEHNERGNCITLEKVRDDDEASED
ncbi:MAG: ATP-binding protein [Planctomycetota bacterium]